MSKNKIVALDQREHVLMRSSMYIGHIKNAQGDFYISDEASKIIFKEGGIINHGLHRIFLEILSNAIDNFFRSEGGETPSTTIKISINRDIGEIIVYNDGNTILIEKDAKSGLYYPELAFGQMLAGSNFNDSEKRLTSGTNGVGSTATNIFSKEFEVTTYDTVSGKKYNQLWKNNMSEKGQPTITSLKNKKGYTEVRFIPDYARFGVTGLSDDMYKLFHKHVIDTAMITGINVYFNDVKIKIRTLREYALMYIPNDVESLQIVTESCKVVLIPNSTGIWRPISFVNGVETYQGGVHVNAWIEALLKPVLEKINSKKKDSSLSFKEIKNYFQIFLNCNLINPTFTSQEKVELSSPNVKVEVEDKHIKTILKWDVIDNIRGLLEAKELVTLKKVEKKTKTFKKIEGLDPANLAGGSKSLECSLILCEGDSAKTMAISGIATGVHGKAGRDYFGVYALRGKCLNTRNKTSAIISKNKEICDLIQALNLKIGLDYSDDKNFSTLNYGRVICLADSDSDGCHITGLLINFFHHMFPSLLKRSFLTSMRTPIIRITINPKNVKEFYTMKDYSEYASKNGNKGDIKYIKGLGTNTRQDALRIFGKKMVEFVNDKLADENINKVFNGKLTDQRKTWLEAYDPSNSKEIVSKDPVQQLNISDFLNNEMIEFSIDDCGRSLPRLMDGLKESQAKILYAVFLKNLKYSGKSLKIAQLAGFVSEKTGYHHGEQCLNDTITMMTQGFVGANNIPILYGDGQTGSLVLLGKDAASARYTYTKMGPLTNLIFRQEDSEILNYRVDEGEQIEPEYFVPIIPMILINGASGIGTGFSCDIPNFNPKEIISEVKRWISGGRNNFSVDLKPWYNNFKGSIVLGKTKNQYITSGIVTQDGKNVMVTALPIGMAIEKFKDFLDDLREEKKIKSYSNYSTDEVVNFTIKETPDFKCTLESLKLTSTLSINNMTMFDSKRKIHRYKDISEIIIEFCETRLDAYVRRRNLQIKVLRREKLILENKKRFLDCVMTDKINLKVEDSVLDIQLEKLKFDRDEGGFDYLLRMNIRSFTVNKRNELESELSRTIKKLEALEKSTPEQIWLNELEELEKMMS